MVAAKLATYLHGGDRKGEIKPPIDGLKLTEASQLLNVGERSVQRHLTIALIVALVPVAAAAAEIIPGPINARVVSVYDGDTMTVDAEPWPGLTARTSVRLAGVDTPEIRGKCQREKDLAVRARDFVRATVGAMVRLTDVRPGKYAGRVIADVWINEQKLSDLLIAENLGRPYDGGRREGWCP